MNNYVLVGFSNYNFKGDDGKEIKGSKIYCIKPFDSDYGYGSKSLEFKALYGLFSDSDEDIINKPIILYFDENKRVVKYDLADTVNF